MLVLPKSEVLEYTIDTTRDTYSIFKPRSEELIHSPLPEIELVHVELDIIHLSDELVQPDVVVLVVQVLDRTTDGRERLALDGEVAAALLSKRVKS